MKAYYTGLVPGPGEHLAKPVRGRGWYMKMRLRPDKCCDDYDPGKPEIVIFAPNQDRAEAALALFVDAMEVLSGPWGTIPRLVPEDDAERAELAHMLNDRSLGWSAGNFDIAAAIARRASQNRRFAYALALYAVSCRCHVNDPMTFEPCNYPYKSRSETHRDHARFAYAIIAAYSVVEQLRLTPEPKSFENGNWIPEKRQALEAKLRKAGINLTEPIMWHVRGGRTRLEIARPPKIVKMCPWSYRQLRDCEIEIVDAIADMRSLRSGVAAHDLKQLARLLSVHDVANAQFVARSLILTAMGFGKAAIKRFTAKRKYPRRQRIPLRWRRDRAAERRAHRKVPQAIQI